MKAKKEDIIRKVSELAAPVCERLGLILYDVDFYKEGADYNLCVLIDKKGGVFIEDCENVSRELDPLLDEADPIDCPYCLEVSSCGADRKLTKPEHFEAALGERVKLGFYTQIDGAKSATGILKSYSNGDVTIEIDGIEKTYIAKNISNVKIDVDFDALLAQDSSDQQ